MDIGTCCNEEIKMTVKGEAVRVEKLAKIGANVLGGSVYMGKLKAAQDRIVAVHEWVFRTKVGGGDEVVHDLASLQKQVSTLGS